MRAIDKGGKALAARAMTRHVGGMLKPRAPFLISVSLGFLGALLAAALRAIFDVTVQDFWKDTASPFLREHVGPWSATMLEWIGPYWSGVGSAFLLMFCVEMVFAWRRKRWAQSEAPVPSEPALPIKAPRSLVRLRFSGRAEQPEEISIENVETWFSYWSQELKINFDNGDQGIHMLPTWAIFIVYLRPIDSRQVVVNFTGLRPERWQVRRHTPMSAVITIDSPMPACEMEIVTRS